VAVQCFNYGEQRDSHITHTHLISVDRILPFIATVWSGACGDRRSGTSPDASRSSLVLRQMPLRRWKAGRSSAICCWWPLLLRPPAVLLTVYRAIYMTAYQRALL